jgi:hypothetical protein
VVDVPEMKGRVWQRAVIQGRMKVILDATGARVYDLAADPSERTPLTGPSAEQASSDARRVTGSMQVTPPKPCTQSVPGAP